MVGLGDLTLNKLFSHQQKLRYMGTCCEQTILEDHKRIVGNTYTGVDKTPKETLTHHACTSLLVFLETTVFV